VRIPLLLGGVPVFLLALSNGEAIKNDTCACRGDRDVVGPCFTVHGRIRIRAGAPSVSIWVVGTRHHLGVSESHRCSLPTGLERRLTLDVSVFGDFTVCPYTREHPGKMQLVCILGARNLAVVRNKK
jgi:hypothetical protein